MFGIDFLCISGQYEYAALCLPTHLQSQPQENGCTMYIHCGLEAANVNISTIESTQFLSLQPNEVHKMSFDEDFFPIGGVESKAIRVESNLEVQVLVFKESYASASSYQYEDVYEAPVSRESEMQFVTSGYNVMTCTSGSYANQFYIVSTFYDNTTITIQYQNDLPFEIVLPRFGSFATVSFDFSDPIASGTLITSDAPVTVVSGTLCEYNPYGSGSYISNIPPFTSLADHYIIPHLIAQNTESPGFSLQVVASDDNTIVDFNGNVVELEAIGNSTTFELDDRREWMSLNCSKNCLAIQYTKTLQYDVYGMFMLPMVGVQEFYTSTSFTTLDLHPVSYISLVVEGEAPGTNILLNGDSLGHLDWGIIDGYATAETAIDSGTYVMESVDQRPFAVFVYIHSDERPGGAGYTRFSINRDIPPTATLFTTTPSTTTTPPPTDGNYTLPQLSVRLNGTVYTEDGQDMTPQCAQVLIL